MNEDDLKVFEDLDISDEAKEKLVAHFGGVVDKKNELMGKFQDARKKLREGEGPDAKALRDELDNLKAAQQQREDEAKGNYEAALKTVQERAEKAIAEATERAAKAETGLTKLITERDVNTALEQVGVLPELKDAVIALHRDKVSIADDVAMIDEVPVADYFGAWAKTDGAKAFIAAETNTGGGAKGSGNDGKTVTSKPRSQMTTKEASDFISEHGRDKYLALPVE